MKDLIFDTHAHYDDQKFDEDRDKLLRDDRIFKVINCGVDIKSSVESINLSKEYPKVLAAIGVHPSEAAKVSDEFINELYKLYKENDNVVAIGEIGLDYHYDDVDRECQLNVFKKQLILANELSIPVIIHDREAHEDTLKLLKKYNVKGVVHCFSGSVEMAREIVNMGMYIGIGGAVTFKKAKKILGVAQEIPLDRILLETDAPYMAPEPNRGKRCDSRMISLTAKKIADLRGISEDEVLEKAKENAINLFLNNQKEQCDKDKKAKKGDQKPQNKPKTKRNNEGGDIITYIFEGSLYVNVTNRCPNRCDFCIRNNGDGVGDADNLWLKKEPSKEEILEDIKKRDLSKFPEIVICGYGEPTQRLDDILWVCRKIKRISNIKIRINTNGLSDLINGRSTPCEFEGIVDAVSISLNASNKEKYDQICHSRFGADAFDSVIKFTRQIRLYVPMVYLSVVDADMDKDEIEACKQLSNKLGVKLKIREYIK